MKTIIFNEIQGRFRKSIKKGRLIALRWSASLQMQFFNSQRISFQSQKKSFISETIYILPFSDAFFNTETILLINKRNVLNFNGCILKGT